MKFSNIIPCTCIKYKPDSAVSSYYGNPILKVCAYDDGKQIHNYFDAVCPRCGNHLIGQQFESAYLAIKAWNEWQKELWNQKDIQTGELIKDFANLPSLTDGDGWPWNEPQASINKELAEWP